MGFGEPEELVNFDTEVDAAPLLDVLGDAVSREILSAAAGTPVTVEQLAETCDVSESTVYRRLDRLNSLGLVEHTSSVTADGKGAYQTTMQGLYVSVDDGEILVALDDAPEDALGGAMRMVLEVLDLQQLRYDAESNTVDVTVGLQEDDFETFLKLYSDS